MNKINGARATSYITTAIPFVNAPPHVGHALELAQADALARQQRALGRDVRLCSGTDDHSLKNARAAELAGVETSWLVSQNAARFRQLAGALRVDLDDFISTSSDPRHRPAVERLWQRCLERGDLAKRRYSGLFCAGCEHFYRPGELPDDLCPEHQGALEEVEEDNYFFRLSRYADDIRRLLKSGGLCIQPRSRLREVEGLLDAGLSDISVSRPVERARGWGIPVPGDPQQVVFVWFDALANYISALDYASDSARFDKYWARGDERLHLIGKGILRFHALHWPAILLSAGLRPPSAIWVHGYLTVAGNKIGKSLGNGVDPFELISRYGPDSLRYYLLRHVRSALDGDFSEEKLRAARSSELANQFGNLVRRTTKLIEQHSGGLVPEVGRATSSERELVSRCRALGPAVAESVGEFEFHRGLDRVWAELGVLNAYIETNAPWRLATLPAQRERLETVLGTLHGCLSLVVRTLAPFLPDTTEDASHQLGLLAAERPVRVATGKILFSKAVI